MIKAKSKERSLLWQQLVRNRPRGGRWLPHALQSESTRCPALPAEPRSKPNISQPFATPAFGSEFFLACMILIRVNVHCCEEGLNSSAPGWGRRWIKMMEDTLCAESKWQCIPGAKEEFLRYSLTQHFRAKHHLEKSYFLLGLLFVVKCFCSSVSGGGCVRL